MILDSIVLTLKVFFATEGVFTFVMIAYNLKFLIRTFVLQEIMQKTLSTLRYKTFAVGPYFEKQNDKLVLRIALNKKRQKWYCEALVPFKELKLSFLKFPLRNLG